MTTADRAQYLHLVVRGLMDEHGMPLLDAVRRAREWVLDHGDDYPAADVVAELARRHAC